MIYVTVGKMPLGFDRLVMAADEMAVELDERVFIQRGSTNYVPKSAEYADFIAFDEAERLIGEAEVVVSHAGIGTIIGSLRSGTPIVVVPRLKKYGEHFNDHQLEVCTAIEGRPGVEVVYETGDLVTAVKRLTGLKGAFGAEKPGAGMIRVIEYFLESLEMRR
jgi:UDP-N-acetylglucosamine transferase subunit ALG13